MSRLKFSHGTDEQKEGDFVAEKKNSSKSPDNPGSRDKAGRFRKGESGNPNGRPKIPSEVKEMFKAATTDAAKLLIETMNDSGADIKLRIDCAEKIIERVYGKPTQPIDGDMIAKIEIKLPEGAEEYAG
jgi:hypothetical protein